MTNVAKEFCCVECFSDIYVQEMVREADLLGDCQYCAAKRVAIAPVAHLAEAFYDKVVANYEPISRDNTIWDDEEHGFMDDGLDLFEEFQNVFSDDGEELFWDILDFADDDGFDNEDAEFSVTDRFQQWTTRDTISSERGDEWREEWDSFCGAVRRATFFSLRHADAVELLRECISDAKTVLPAGTALYRARRNPDAQKMPLLAAEMGMPPRELAYHPGRCNLKNRPVLYTAEDRATALAEATSGPALYSVAKMRTDRDIKLADPLRPVVINYMFQPDAEQLYRTRRLLEGLAEELAHPAQGDVTHYRASQFLSRVVQRCGFEGLRYRSGKGSACNVVLFKEDGLTFHTAVKVVRYGDVPE